VLSEGGGPLVLTSLSRREELINQLGIEHFGVVEFDVELAKLSAREFSQQILIDQLGMRALCVGKDFTLGRHKQGDEVMMRGLGSELGFSTGYVEPVVIEGLVVSSSRIRDLIRGGEVETAAQLLSRPYDLSGSVVEGEGRGRDLGFPTANLDCPPNHLIPGAGVYAVRCDLGDQQYLGVTNVGKRPTFGAGNLATVETHLLDFDREIYGMNLTIQFIGRIRNERAFTGGEELKKAIGNDIHQARLLLV
jgi:riboflavin kinase/FMN adenylyltransferase